MKYRILPAFRRKIPGFAFCVFCLVLPIACENGPIHSSYQPVLPELPPYWKEILGEAHWRLEWIDKNGAWQEWEGREAPEIPLPQEWATAVLAWPFWPAKDLIPGMMRPSGAIFPWDVFGDTLVLSWSGGVDALFWKEMAGAERTSTASEGRLPWYFDWPRFRELFESENIPENVRLDPWLPDWRTIAQKTVQSGFDRRRIVSRTFTERSIPGFGGLWVGSSPFAPPVFAPEEGPLLLKTTATPDTWVSAGGILKCSTTGWVWREMPK